MFTLVPLPFFWGDLWGWEGQLEREMRCFNTPLPFSFSPTPPHTWDGHFISEYSKWKGDLNLPCLPVTPFPSPSPTHSFCCWWTERCRLPIADIRVSYVEKLFFFQVLSSVVSSFCFIGVFCFCDWQSWKSHLRKYFSLFSLLCSSVPLAPYCSASLTAVSALITAVTSQAMQWLLISYE